MPVTGDEGLLDLDALDRLLDAGVKLFAFTHVSNTLGTVNPATELCARARALGITTLVDAAQSAGHMPVDVQDIGCDFLAFSGHKMCGPTGIGVLYGREELLEQMPPWQGGGEMISSVDFFESQLEHRCRTSSRPARRTSPAPIALARGDGLPRRHRSRPDLRATTRSSRPTPTTGSREIPRLRGLRPASGRAGLVSFVLPDVHAHDVVTLADHRGVALRGGPSLQPAAHAQARCPSTARASFYFYNTVDEIDRMIEILAEIQQYFSRGS